MARALSSEEARELAALRQRAYGPSPDIAEDPRALARLASLEAALHAAPQESAPQPTSRSEAPSVSRAVAPPDPAGEAPAAIITETRRRDRVAGLVRSGWAVAALAVLVGGAVVWATVPVSAPRSDLVLAHVSSEFGNVDRSILPSFITSEDFGLRELQRFQPYGPLEALLAISERGDRCMLLDAADYGVVGISCTPEGLDPIVDLRVRPGLREDILGDLPVDTVLRFQYRDERVHVWVRSPAESA